METKPEGVEIGGEESRRRVQRQSRWSRLFRRLLMALLWLLMLFGGRFTVSAELMHVLFHRMTAVVLVASLACVLLIVAFRKGPSFAVQRTIDVVIEFLFFPVVLVLTAWEKLRLVVRRMAKLSEFPRRAEVLILALLLAIAAARLISLTSHRSWILASMVALGVCLVLCCSALYSWTTSPYGLWERILDLLYRIWIKLVVKRNQADKKRVKVFGIHLRPSGADPEPILPLIEQGCRLTESVFRKPDKMLLVKNFLAFVVFIIVTSMVIFGFEYYGLEKACPGSFLGSDGTIWQFMLFSAGTFVTYQLGHLQPANSLAQFLIISQVFITVFFLMVVILMFTSITEETAGAAGRRILKRIQKVRQQIEAIRSASDLTDDTPGDDDGRGSSP